MSNQKYISKKYYAWLKIKKKDLQAALYHNKYIEKKHLIHNSQEVKGCI